ncbi:hypothetical protein GCM10023257_69950 [Streptomyces hyderabadensis]|uniref:Transposase n=1 Tax=Streptomyces hyderabadensis TaxID=598549 RepID=A0ABP9IYY8_9ACTN
MGALVIPATAVRLLMTPGMSAWNRAREANSRGRGVSGQRSIGAWPKEFRTAGLAAQPPSILDGCCDVLGERGGTEKRHDVPGKTGAYLSG